MNHEIQLVSNLKVKKKIIEELNILDNKIKLEYKVNSKSNRYYKLNNQKRDVLVKLKKIRNIIETDINNINSFRFGNPI